MFAISSRPGASTPTTPYATPSIVRVRPRAACGPPRSFTAIAWVTTATGGASEGQVVEQDAAHGAESRRRGADAEPQDQDRREREAGTVRQGAQRVARVGDGVLQGLHAARLAHIVLGTLEAAERDSRGTA